MKRVAVTLSIVLATSCGSSRPATRHQAPARSPGIPLARPTAPTPTPTPTYRGVRPFSARRAMSHVRVLAGRIGPRPAGSAGYRRALGHVEGELARLGYAVSIRSFPLPQGGRSANVVAATGDGGVRALVIGAHLDTVPPSPGGNDNASGVGVMIELARALEGTRFQRRITFIAFGAEEIQPDGTHHLGSEDFVADLRRAERERIRAMVSVDMIGKDVPIIVGSLDGDRAAVRALVRAARRVDVATDPEVVGDVSDHGPFALAGVPAALLWTGPEPDYHSAGDVASNVDLEALRNVGAVLLSLVRATFRR